jgi:hypothetical protein
MERIVISKKIYTELMNAMRRLATVNRKKKMRFIEGGFGVFRENFGNESSVEYVTNLRKSWRA